MMAKLPQSVRSHEMTWLFFETSISTGLAVIDLVLLKPSNLVDGCVKTKRQKTGKACGGTDLASSLSSRSKLRYRSGDRERRQSADRHHNLE
jgi:hypothetical protein